MSGIQNNFAAIEALIQSFPRCSNVSIHGIEKCDIPEGYVRYCSISNDKYAYRKILNDGREVTIFCKTPELEKCVKCGQNVKQD